MKKQIVKILGLVILGTGLLVTPTKAETITIDDFNFSVGNVPAGAAGGVLSGRWGVWNTGTSTFVQAVTSSLNAGYVDLSTPELSITLNQTTAGNYAAGTAMALAIFTDGSADAQALNYGSATRGAIFTDSSWVAPSWANNANMISFAFSVNTIARLGSYNFNGGNEILTLAVIPEPSTFSLLLAGFGLVAARLRRKRA
jgi:PEP-CTERM motif